VGSANQAYLLAVPPDSSRQEAMMGAAHGDMQLSAGDPGRHDHRHPPH
jgi:hypothetical protein